MTFANGHVLIVTQAAELGEGIRMALQRLGVASVLATTGADAVHRISDDPPDALVIDLRFTDMEPLQIVHRAVACRETHGLPIVALGGEPEDRESLLDGGCTAILHRDATPLAAADVTADLLRLRIRSESAGGMGLRLEPGDAPPDEA